MRSIARHSRSFNWSPVANSIMSMSFDRLVDACHRNGLVKDDGLRSVVATIRSGRRAGLQYPRSRSGAS